MPESWVGLFVCSLTVGIALGTVVACLLSGDWFELGLVPLGAGMLGVSLFAASLSINHWFVAVCLVAVGFAGGLFAVPLNKFVQHQAKVEDRGHIIATRNFANTLAVILACGLLWLSHDHLAWTPALVLSVLGLTHLLASLYLAYCMGEAVLRFLLWCIANLLFRIRMEGRKNIPSVGPALIVSNHISYADSVLVGCTTRSRTIHFLMWKPIFDLPIANHLFRALRAIPIDGRSPKNTMRALQSARAELTRGELVAIFPEGSISTTGVIKDFERGFDRVLQGTEAPVIPIHIDGLYGHPFSYKGGGPFKSWERLCRPIVTVRIDKPIYGPLTTVELRQRVLSA